MKYRLTITQNTYARMEVGEGKRGSINLSNGFLLKGKCDVERLDRAVKALHKRHDAMRMSMSEDSEGLYFEFNDEEPYGLEMIELRSEGRDERFKEAYADASNRVRTPVSLDKKSMYRYWIYKITDEEYMLYYVANHLATDGGSMALLNAELAKLYEDPDRIDLPVYASFADFLGERERLYREKFTEEEKKYWDDRMAGYENPKMEPPKVQETESTMQYGRFTVPLEKLEKISRSMRSSNFNVLFTLIQLAAAELTGQNDIALRYAFANRFKKEFQGTIGFLTHGVTIRHIFSPEERWSELAVLQRDTMNHDMKHLTFSDCIEVKEYLLSYIPNNGKKGEKMKFGDLDVEPLVFHSHFTSGRRYVGLVAVEHGEDLYVTPYCDNRLYGREFVLGLGRCINKYVDRILAMEDPTVEDLFRE
ncbi:MAG: hypothetical protein K5898_04190 [Ruminococcus sp.]|uniref:condensation domain-containing protein n=1 Tax=Ruminococcus sp. TaxID=41978 RepID=UPI0025F2687A|nr:condensation domain-containing protein [Ruminococcus sp.]MCR4794364.1 hypothetical protein [Ruminococcus sp.]